jgi:acyl carrier protein phosphodiesterase
MNYLAHTALAQPNHCSLVGNLLGDFCKGVPLHTLPAEVLSGLANHRAVDKFTDTYPELVQLKQQFSLQRRRFAGIAMDVLFDHFLMLHWQRFYPHEFRQYKRQLYADLAAAEYLMPATMKATMRRVRCDDWLASYQHLPSLGLALDQIARRIRFANQFAGIIDEIMPLYTTLEQAFLRFYPELQRHIAALQLER